MCYYEINIFSLENRNKRLTFIFYFYDTGHSHKLERRTSGVLEALDE